MSVGLGRFIVLDEEFPTPSGAWNVMIADSGLAGHWGMAVLAGHAMKTLEAELVVAPVAVRLPAPPQPVVKRVMAKVTHIACRTNPGISLSAGCVGKAAVGVPDERIAFEESRDMG